MPSTQSTDPRLDQARDLIRDKGLSRKDIQLLEEILRESGSGLFLLQAPGEPEAKVWGPAQPVQLARLRRSFGLFLVFLNQFSGRHPEESRSAMGLVLQHSLAGLAEAAAAAHREMLARNQEPEWIVQLLDLVAALRTMATSLGSETPDGPQLKDHWAAFLREEKAHFRKLFAVLGEGEGGAALVGQLGTQMKLLNSTLKAGSGNPLAAMRSLEMLLESALPEDTRQRAEPLLLVQHVIASLRLSLSRPLDGGIHWPAVERIRGSLQWLWDHLGWNLPRVEDPFLERSLPRDVRDLLKLLRESHPPSFRIVARALASHLALLNLVEGLEPAANAPIPVRYAQVPYYSVIEAELGRLAERVFHPRVAETLVPGSEEALLLGAFLRQAVLSLLQDQATIHNLLQQALANEDVDQLAAALDGLRPLLLGHQRQLMGDLVGLFSPELRQKLFPDSPSLTEEGERLRQRLYRLWQYLDPVLARIQVHLELKNWPRLALALAQAQNQVVAFRRSPEFVLIRSQDRQEFERLTQQLVQTLEDPEEIEPALGEGAEIAGELLRFLDVFLMRINARVPLIRLDLNTAREAHRLGSELTGLQFDAPDRTRITHKLIQATKTLAVRDPQSLNLLKRWIRAERGGRDVHIPLQALLSHLEHLSLRLDTALN
jgi:DNA-binding phage protein